MDSQKYWDSFCLSWNAACCFSLFKNGTSQVAGILTSSNWWVWWIQWNSYLRAHEEDLCGAWGPLIRLNVISSIIFFTNPALLRLKLNQNRLYGVRICSYIWAPEENLCGAPSDSDMHHHFQYRYQMNSWENWNASVLIYWVSKLP